MKLEEIQGKPDAELRTLLDTSKEELWRLRFAATTEPIDNPGKIRDLKKRIAWIRGELRTRELKVTGERVRGELSQGDRTTRELAKALGTSIEKAKREAIRLERRGHVHEIRRGSPLRGTRAWALKPKTGAQSQKEKK